MKKIYFVFAFLLTVSCLKAQTYATLPFDDNLSSGLGSHWSISDSQGVGTATVADLSGGWPNFGTCSSSRCKNVGVTSGNGMLICNTVKPTGSNQINMDLHLNLSGATAVELSQAIVDWGSGWDSLKIYLSNDAGSNFTEAAFVKLWRTPYMDGFWNELTFDISTLAASSGVSFSSTYIVDLRIICKNRGRLQVLKQDLISPYIMIILKELG